MDFYYHGAWRMDWGLGNPNKTATLIACLMLAVWAPAYGKSRAGFWLALAIFTGLGWCLVQTYSRGGMLALLSGSAVILAWTPWPWRKSRVIGVTLATCLIGVFAGLARAEDRYEQGIFTGDASITSRLEIWKHFPEMLAAAPLGAGWGRAGDFYTQWFQPTNQSFNYLNLINSHLTWMVEGGWIFSAFYIISWCAVLIICWPDREWRLGPLPLAVWTALGVGACFSHVENTIWLWLAPLAALAYSLIDRCRFGRGPSARNITGAAVGSILFVLLVIATGRATTQSPITATANAIYLGRGANVTAIYIDRTVMGQFFGHTLRQFLEQNRNASQDHLYIVTESPGYPIPSSACEIVLAGQTVREALSAAASGPGSRVIILNPMCFPVEARWEEALAARSALYWGEYADSPARASWGGPSGMPAHIITGAGEFIPLWPQVIWQPMGSKYSL